MCEFCFVQIIPQADLFPIWQQKKSQVYTNVLWVRPVIFPKS